MIGLWWLSKHAALFLAALILTNAAAFSQSFTNTHWQSSAALSKKSADTEVLSSITSKNGYVSIIVEFAPRVDPKSEGKDRLDAKQAEVKDQAWQDRIVHDHFGDARRPREGSGFKRSLRRIPFSPMFSLKVSRHELEALAVDPRVVAIYYNRPFRPLLNDSIPLIGMRGAAGAFAHGADGHGQTIAIIDAGVQKSHPFITSDKVVLEACFSKIDPDLGLTSLCPNGDETDFEPGAGANCPANLSFCAHGTHVAGIAAGNNTRPTSGGPASGVAKAARIVAIQISSQSNDANFCNGKPPPCAVAGFTDTILEALYWLSSKTDELAKKGAPLAAINLSLSDDTGTCDRHPATTIIGLLRNQKNVATVIGSGNDGRTNSVSSPACIPSAIAVAASTKGTSTKPEKIWLHSNISNLVGVFAPGEAIVSSVLNNGYGAKSGTSMAAPHVAGAVAALRSAIPYATVDGIEKALKESGPIIRDTRNGGTVSRRRIQVAAALNKLAPVRLEVSPTTEKHIVGMQGAAFSPASITYELKASKGTITYIVTGIPPWLHASSSSGAVTQASKSVVLTTNGKAALLPPGQYSALLIFANKANTKDKHSRTITIEVRPNPANRLRLTPSTDMAFVGPAGGSFGPNQFSYELSASASTIRYQISNVPTWLTASTKSGVISNASKAITFTINNAAKALPAGTYASIITFLDQTNGKQLQRKATLRVDEKALVASLDDVNQAVLSADGSTVGGERCVSGVCEAVRWTWAAGLHVIGRLPGDVSSTVTGISADGSILVGRSCGSFGCTAFRWSATAGLQGLGISVAEKAVVSSDGSSIIGIGSDDKLFHWTTASTRRLDLPAGYTAAWWLPLHLSGDGTIAAGSALTTAGLIRPFRWTASDGSVVLDGEGVSSPTGMSSDGAVLVGWQCDDTNCNGFRGFRWTVAGGLTPLNLLPGHKESYPLALSADGRTAVGFSGGSPVIWRNANSSPVNLQPADITFGASVATVVNSNGGVVAGDFRWTPATGTQGLGQLGLAATGTVIGEWVSGLSADGTVLVGPNPWPVGGTWIARLPLQGPSLELIHPSTNISLGPQGGPFSPTSITYSLRASYGEIFYVIPEMPNWLSTNKRWGIVGTEPTEITLTTNNLAGSFPPGLRNESIMFVNGSTGQGNVNAQRTLQITAATPNRPFQPLGGAFSGKNGFSEVAGMSADGSVVVGHNRPGQHSLGYCSEDFVWTLSTGMVRILGDRCASNNAANFDGSVTVGASYTGGVANSHEAFRWTAATGVTPLNFNTEVGESEANAVNGDGTVVVGRYVDAASNTSRAFRWTAGEAGGDISSGFYSASAGGVSSDGQSVVGSACQSASDCQAFIWTKENGLTRLGVLSGYSSSEARAISSDGKVVVGRSCKSGDCQAFRWTASSGMVGLGFLAGPLRSEAAAANADGTVVVGNSNGVPFRWTDDTGMQNLRQLLQDAGEDIAPNAFQSPTAVSGDGFTIAGNGSNGGWLVRLRAPELAKKTTGASEQFH